MGCWGVDVTKRVEISCRMSMVSRAALRLESSATVVGMLGGVLGVEFGLAGSGSGSGSGWRWALDNGAKVPRRVDPLTSMQVLLRCTSLGCKQSDSSIDLHTVHRRLYWLLLINAAYLEHSP